MRAPIPPNRKEKFDPKRTIAATSLTDTLSAIFMPRLSVTAALAVVAAATVPPIARWRRMSRHKSSIDRIGVVVSDVVSDLAAHPFAQLATLAFCVAWFALGLSTNVLSAAMAILAILLTQMVLNKQNEREADAHRRDVAMHAKLDELLLSSGHAHNEMAGIEELEEEQITQIARRVHAKTTSKKGG